MWILFHFIFLYFCQPSSIMHLFASVLFMALIPINTRKINTRDVVPTAALIGMYIGFYLTQELYHWAYLPWWVTTICGFRKQKIYIWAGGVILGCLFFLLSWRQRIGHCIMNLCRMLKLNEQSMASLAIAHLFMGVLFTMVGEFDMDKMYIDVLASISAVSCACWPDHMSWFSIGMVFTHPLAGALCLIHLCSPYWYHYYKNNHYRKVKYTFYFVYPVLILLGLFFREEIELAKSYIS